MSQPGELAAYVQSTLRKRLAQGAAAGTVSLAGSLLDAAPAATVAGEGQCSGTLVQEAGVDEADLLLSCGQQLYTLQPGDAADMKVRVYRCDNQGVAQPQQTLALGSGTAGLVPQGLLLAEDGSALVDLPVALADATYSQWTSGPPRYEVDTRNAQLLARPLLGRTPGLFSGGTSWDRSLQIGQQVYHLRAGVLHSFDW